MRRVPLAQILIVSLLMSVGEFVEVQQLSPDGLRTRFGLPPGCDPAMTALTTDAGDNRVTVAVECRVKPPESPAPTERRRPSGPAGPGSSR